MKILGIETATPLLGAALISESDPAFREERATPSQSSHCELINGFIQDLTGRAGITLEQLDAVAVSIGPGSFTGLRIGIASAMGLAWALGLKISPVSTLMGIAWPHAIPGALVCPLLDAKRGEAYAAIYRMSPGKLPDTIREPAALPIAMLVREIAGLGEPVILTGPGVVPFEKPIREELTGLIRSAEPSQPTALAIAEIGLLILAGGGAEEPEHIRPVYLRRSDAEIARDGACPRP